jgi:hypothetical protein
MNSSNERGAAVAGFTRAGKSIAQAATPTEFFKNARLEIIFGSIGLFVTTFIMITHVVI